MGNDKYIKNYIDGSLVPPLSDHYLDDYNPATGKVYAHLPDSGEEEIDRAVRAAGRAFPGWSAAEPQRRFRLLMRLADIIEQNLEAYARAESIDTGKPFSMSASVDIPRAQANFRFYASAILHERSEAYHQAGESIHYTIRQPLGVVACLGPWNLPLYLLTWKIAPALAAGNCVVANVSELTPMTAFLLSKACIEAGLPKGVLNIVHGRWEKVGLPLAGHPGIRALTFVGDSATGATLATRLAGSFKKLSFTLSGKNPNVIFEDCHFDQMMVGTLRSSFSNNGQLSFSGSRIFVQRPIYEKFRDQLVKRTQFLKVGDPFSAVTDLGALISREHKERVLSYLALAEVEGGKILCGGQPLDLPGELGKGFFLRPAVIEGLPVDCRTNQEEIFGPVVTIAPFDTEEEAVALANASDYGLSATVWSQDIRRAHRVAEKIRAGMVWINGWMVQDLRPSLEPGKQSGISREGGAEALQFFSENKTICVKY